MLRFATVVLLALSACAPLPEGDDRVQHAPSLVRVEGARGGSIEIGVAGETRASGRAVAGTPEDVWLVLPKVYRDLELEVNLSEPDQRILGARNIRVRRSLGDLRMSLLLRCGSGPTGPNADRYAITMTVATRVTPADGQTVAVTQVTGFAQATGQSRATVTCASTGRLEREIAERITAYLNP